MSIFSKDFFKYFTGHPLVRNVLEELNKFWQNTYAWLARHLKGLKIPVNKFWLKVILVFVVAIVVFMLLFVAVLFEVSDRNDNSLYKVVIPKGASADQVASILLKQDLIQSRFGIKFALGFFGLSNKIQAGSYHLSKAMTLNEIVHRITAGKVAKPDLVKITIPEGKSIYKIGELLTEQGFNFGEEFKYLTNKKIPDDLITKYPFLDEVDTKSLEGYLFPDTYYVAKDVAMYDLVDIMLRRFDELVIPFWEEVKEKTDYSLHEILTLASIIEKEAAYDFERPLISSIFHNRLDIKMALEADPTVKYVLGNPTKRVLYKDLEVNSPYNTYKYRGLPPGPICNPGYYSIKYAIYPDETDYLYFVAKKDGTHIFSRTWAEHQAARVEARQ